VVYDHMKLIEHIPKRCMLKKRPKYVLRN
jgi:hypothetical protein